MLIRKAKLEELDEIMEIYASARSFMAKEGNGTQWGQSYPSRELIREHIGTKMYVCEENGEIAAVFYFAIEKDPTYKVIEKGAWLSDEPYGVVHRIASSMKVKGAAKKSLLWAYEKCKNLRIDTHENNLPMQNLLKGLGFSYCGIIYLENGEERLAFQKED